MPKLLNGIKGDSNPGSLDCESGILPLSHRAPQVEAFWIGDAARVGYFVPLNGPLNGHPPSNNNDKDKDIVNDNYCN